MYLMIDNYDSFVYNLKAYFQELGREILVKRCDEITLDEIERMHPEGIVLSPGPNVPGMQSSVWRQRNAFREKSRFWESVWDIRYWGTVVVRR